MKHIRCFLVPDLIGEHILSETVVVIDVLRASTTICAALSQGANRIVPFEQIEEATAFANQHPGVLLGGERGGIPIDGFDLGNSPSEYSTETVSGKTIAFTTTNGTRAMTACRDAGRILIGSFCNLSRIVGALDDRTDFELICSGTNGEITLEDCIFAGAVIDRFAATPNCELNDQARICLRLWQSVESNLLEALNNSRGGQNLIRLEKSGDIEFASQIDSLDVLPILDANRWKIEPA